MMPTMPTVSSSYAHSHDVPAVMVLGRKSVWTSKEDYRGMGLSLSCTLLSQYKKHKLI